MIPPPPEASGDLCSYLKGDHACQALNTRTGANRILLQVMDDGRLTDRHGRTVDFRNVILIMTSNVGSAFVLEARDALEAERRALEALRGTFKPEFLNRLDGVVVFKRLDEGRIREIVDIQLRQLHPLLAQRDLALEVTDGAKRFLSEVGYDPAYGARPLRRAIQEYVLEPLSEKLIAGQVHAGQRVVVDAADGHLEFHAEDRRAAA